MKAKMATVAIGLFLPAAAAIGAAGDGRFLGGPYDGWSLAAIPHAWGLDGGPQVSLWSAPGQAFSWTAEYAPLATLTIGAWEPQGAITNGGTLRVSVPAAWLWCRFDTGAPVTLGGGAAGKVGAADFSGDGRTLRIQVTADFADGDTLTVSGLVLTGWRLASADTQRLALDFTGDSAGDTYDAYALQVNAILWRGGPYDGWETATSGASVFYQPRGTLLSLF